MSIRFMGVRLAEHKRLWVALTEVYGIGTARARALCYPIGATPTTTAAELRPFHVSQLYAAVDKQYTVANDLRDATRAAVARLVKIRCYRGTRHKEGLPVRGQRTRTNAQTAKRRGKKY
jgi:small subunit ribosomal protein S13